MQDKERAQLRAQLERARARTGNGARCVDLEAPRPKREQGHDEGERASLVRMPAETRAALVALGLLDERGAES